MTTTRTVVRFSLAPWILCRGCGFEFHTSAPRVTGRPETAPGTTCPDCGEVHSDIAI